MTTTVDLFSYRAPAPRRAEPEKLFDHKNREIPQEVCRLFEKFALEVIGRGFEHYSADALLHRIRWHAHIDQGDREFKANDHWTAPLARWFADRYPAHAELFQFRETRKERKQRWHV